MAARVIAVVRVPGFHRWPEAPEVVRFLRERHRHVFTVRCEWVVGGDDRQVEFFVAQGWIRSALATWPSDQRGIEFDRRSCETIARNVAEVLSAFGYPAPSAVEVWEDDEDGSRVEFA